MASVFDSSGEEWDDLVARMEKRIAKSAKKVQRVPPASGLCDQFEKLGLNGLREKAVDIAEKPFRSKLVSTIKNIFAESQARNDELTSDSGDDSPVIAKNRRTRAISSSSSDDDCGALTNSSGSEDGESFVVARKTPRSFLLSSEDENEVSRNLESEGDSFLITRKTPKKFCIESSSEDDNDQEGGEIAAGFSTMKNSNPSSGKVIATRKNLTLKAFDNAGFSSDDEWDNALSTKKKPKSAMKGDPAHSIKKKPLTKSHETNEILARKLPDDDDHWLRMVSPERRKNSSVAISASSRKLFPLMTSPDKENCRDPFEFKVTEPAFGIKHLLRKDKTLVSSPLPSSATFSKYSAELNPRDVLRKIGINFSLEEKPSEALYCSNKRLNELYTTLDKELFHSTLNNHQVDVAWSGRLTKAAGITHYKSKLLMVECDIKLSRPLLKLRPSKDMVETLLHEMIHAYLAVTRNPNGKGHGSEFKKHMSRINAMTGLTLTIYHSFHDEVDTYRNQNVWRCDGVCRSLREFKYGYVRRAINRAPGPHEFWWKKHVDICSGQFVRVYDHPFK